MFSYIYPKTDKSLSNITFTEEDIKKVIRNLESNKAHRRDVISIRILKICVESITKPLQIIYRQCLEKGCFPDEWKKANDDDDDELFFVVWLTDERRLALFPAGTIVRDPHHLESPTRREQDLNLRRTWAQAFLNEYVQQR